MRENTYLEKAVQCYNVAAMIWSQMDSDVYCDFVGYYLQQAVAFAVRYQLDAAGVEYPPTARNVEYLMMIGAQNHVNLHLSEYIEKHCRLLASWQRCAVGSVSTEHIPREDIVAALEGVRRFLEPLAEMAGCGEMLDMAAAETFA